MTKQSTIGIVDHVMMSKELSERLGDWKSVSKQETGLFVELAGPGINKKYKCESFDTRFVSVTFNVDSQDDDILFRMLERKLTKVTLSLSGKKLTDFENKAWNMLIDDCGPSLGYRITIFLVS